MNRFSLAFLFPLFFLQTFQFIYSQSPSGVRFTRINEKNEAAFSFLIPIGWITEGGIFRINAMQAGGPLNAMEAKCDMVCKNNQEGSVYFHILPDIIYVHTGVVAGYSSAGSNYQGAMVRQMVDTKTLVQQIFYYLHPQAVSVNIIKIIPLPGEKKSLDQGLAYTNQMLALIGLQSQPFQSDAAGGIFEYTENGVRYREVVATGLVNMAAAMTWKNTRTLAFRAPIDLFNQWSPVFDIMRNSIEFNPEWIVKEAGGQHERAEIVQKVYTEIRRIDQEMVKNTTINREEIMNDNYLVLTDQEEFINPHSGKIELDTDTYRYRWENETGDRYYTNRQDENPNLFLHQTGYKLTPVRER